MPTYGYRCTVCSHEFERVQKMSDPRITECEECDGLVKKIIYPVGISFKGDGFYINDSKKETSKAKPAETKPAEAESKSTEAKTETASTETKTETKSDTPKTETASASTTKTETKPAAP